MIRFQIFHDPIVFNLGPVPVTRTILTTLGVSISLVLAAAGMRAMVIHRPQGSVAAVAEIVVSWLDDMVFGVVGRGTRWLATFSGSLFLFIAACNLSGQLPGVSPPTANVVTTSALAVLVFFTVPVAGIATQGIRGYLRHYLSPNPILFPLHLISEMSRTLALSVRLFGNIMSGHLIVVLLVAIVGLFIPTFLMALDLLIGMLQAYIFALLSAVYIGAALRAAEEQHEEENNRAKPIS